MRAYGLGRNLMVWLVVWPYASGVQEVVIELKIRYGALDTTINDGLKQTWQYMDQCGTEQGHLIVFDRSLQRRWDEKIFCRQAAYEGHPITVWGM